MTAELPVSVRYVKTGEGGRWWAVSRERGEMHLGWTAVPHALLEARDYPAIDAAIRASFGPKQGATQDINGLKLLLDHPSRFLWITFQEGYMWWCTVRDGITVNPAGSSRDEGHFWLSCDRPWSNTSLNGRALVMANLPGFVTATAGYRATTCEPGGAQAALRIIRDEEDADVIAAAKARSAFEDAVAVLVARLGAKDFELLVDLILARTGWNRVARLGGATEGVDVEAENIAAGELAFVQVKSVAGQAVFDDYVQRYNGRRDIYDRMIFAVHSPRGTLVAPDDRSVQVWSGAKIATLVVKLGLSEWLSNRV